MAVIQPFGCVVASRTRAERLSGSLKGAIEKDRTRFRCDGVLRGATGCLCGGMGIFAGRVMRSA